MPTQAMSLQSPRISPFFDRHYGHVSVTDSQQVLRIDTPTVIARPEYLQAIGNITVKHEVGNPRGMHGYPLPHELGILMNDLTV
jgi:hypothetical protein